MQYAIACILESKLGRKTKINRTRCFSIPQNAVILSPMLYCRFLVLFFPVFLLPYPIRRLQQWQTFPKGEVPPPSDLAFPLDSTVGVMCCDDGRRKTRRYMRFGRRVEDRGATGDTGLRGSDLRLVWDWGLADVDVMVTDEVGLQTCFRCRWCMAWIEWTGWSPLTSVTRSMSRFRWA